MVSLPSHNIHAGCEGKDLVPTMMEAMKSGLEMASTAIVHSPNDNSDRDSNFTKKGHGYTAMNLTDPRLIFPTTAAAPATEDVEDSACDDQRVERGYIDHKRGQNESPPVMAEPLTMSPNEADTRSIHWASWEYMADTGEVETDWNPSLGLFSKLPQELRNQIWSYLLPQTAAEHELLAGADARNPSFCAMSLVNRQICNEFTKPFYNSCSLRFELGPYLMADPYVLLVHGLTRSLRLSNLPDFKASSDKEDFYYRNRRWRILAQLPFHLFSMIQIRFFDTEDGVGVILAR